MKYKFTDKMDEISGFHGSYEEGCRSMVCAGADFLDKYPNIELIFEDFERIFGLINSKNDASEKILDYMVEAAKKLGDCPTGAMVHCAVHHIMFIKKNGWDKYVEEMEKRYLEKE